LEKAQWSQKKVSGECWKVPEGKTIYQQRDLKTEKAGVVSGKFWNIYSLGKGTVKILLIQSGILLDEVEGSRKVLLWS
jgi:hypothetical protein